MSQDPVCSVAIHSLNRRPLLERALHALDPEAGAAPLEIIVADSGSSDGSREMVLQRFPHVRLVELQEDRGLAAGRNAGMQQARGRYVLMMDEDVVITPTQVALLVRLMRAHPQAGIVTCCKVNADGEALYQHHVPAPSSLGLPFFLTQEWSIQEGLRALKRILNVGDSRPHERQEVAEIPFVGGALILARADAIRQVGPWDENIFFYGEDFDWCYRLRQAGWKILYFPQIKVTAHRGTNSTRTRRASLIAMRSRRYLFLKYLGRRSAPLYALIALLGLIPRAAYYALQRLHGQGGHDMPLGRWLWSAVRIAFGSPPRLGLRG